MSFLGSGFCLNQTYIRKRIRFLGDFVFMFKLALVFRADSVDRESNFMLTESTPSENPHQLEPSKGENFEERRKTTKRLNGPRSETVLQ
jgi:hypothetical protein